MDLLTILQILSPAYNIISSITALKIYLLLSPTTFFTIWITKYLKDKYRFQSNQYQPIDNTPPAPGQSNIQNLIIPQPPNILDIFNIKTLSFLLLGTNTLLLVIFLSSIFAIMYPTPTIISPQPPLFSPLNINYTQPLIIEFDRPVSPRTTAIITPTIEGHWFKSSHKYKFPFNFSDQLIFQPTGGLSANTEYTVIIQNIQPYFKHLPSENILFLFKTPADDSTSSRVKSSFIPAINSIKAPVPKPEIATSETSGQKLTNFQLSVPLHKQNHKFTCFATAAQMVLSYYNINLGELDIWNRIPHQDNSRNFLTNTWENPNKGIVGTIDGNGPGGYGVHWQPVADLIAQYRSVEVKTNWNLPELLTEVKAGHPVMVWWVNGVWPAKDVSWNTPTDGKIYTVNGMHVEIVTGWIGPQDNPEYILTNDPWRGHRRYPPETFHNLWKWFDNTAVIVK